MSNNTKKLSLVEAKNLANEIFSEVATRKPTGVLQVEIKENKLCFCIKNKKYKHKVPNDFHGYPCEVRLASDFELLI